MLNRIFKVRTYVSPVDPDGLFDTWVNYNANAVQAFRHDLRAFGLRIAVVNFWVTIKD